jgi:hypothetical protein
MKYMSRKSIRLLLGQFVTSRTEKTKILTWMIEKYFSIYDY